MMCKLLATVEIRLVLKHRPPRSTNAGLSSMFMCWLSQCTALACATLPSLCTAFVCKCACCAGVQCILQAQIRLKANIDCNNSRQSSLAVWCAAVEKLGNQVEQVMYELKITDVTAAGWRGSGQQHQQIELLSRDFHQVRLPAARLRPFLLHSSWACQPMSWRECCR